MEEAIKWISMFVVNLIGCLILTAFGVHAIFIYICWGAFLGIIWSSFFDSITKC